MGGYPMSGPHRSQPVMILTEGALFTQSVRRVDGKTSLIGPLWVS